MTPLRPSLKTLRRQANMIVLIDNYDSFTFNLFHYLGGLGADVVVHRNDKISVADVMALRAGSDRAIARPLHAERSRHLSRSDQEGVGRRFPFSASASVIRLWDRPSVAKWCARRRCTASYRKSSIRIRACFTASTARSRRRAIIRLWSSAPACRRSLIANAETDDHLVMGLMHESLPVHGVQFHPESIASEHGHLMLKNFLDIAAAWNQQRRGKSSAAPRASRPRKVFPARGALRPETHGRRFQSAHRQGRDRGEPDTRGSSRRLRQHDVGRSDALADGRAADGVACARGNRGRDHRRGHHHARQDAGRESSRRTRSMWSAPAAMPPARSTFRLARPSLWRARAYR